MEIINDFEREIAAIADEFSFVKFAITIDKNPEALKMRLFIDRDFFIQAYVNIVMGTRNFCLILGGQRLYGRDCEGGRNWHRHPYHDPASHDFSPEGAREVSFREFTVEVQELIERETLL